MIKKTSDGPLTRVRIIDGFDVFILLVAVVSIIMNFSSVLKSNRNRLAGFTGYITKGRIEKKLSKLNGVKSADLDFYESYGQYSVTAIITPWAGNYDIYSDEVLDEIYSIIMEETGVREDNISIIDSDNGQRIERTRPNGNRGVDGDDEIFYDFLDRVFGI